MRSLRLRVVVVVCLATIVHVCLAAQEPRSTLQAYRLLLDRVFQHVPEPEMGEYETVVQFTGQLRERQVAFKALDQQRFLVRTWTASTSLWAFVNDRWSPTTGPSIQDLAGQVRAEKREQIISSSSSFGRLVRRMGDIDIRAGFETDLVVLDGPGYRLKHTAPNGSLDLEVFGSREPCVSARGGPPGCS